MTIYDIVILAIIGIFAIWGVWRGIIREVFDLTGLIIGVLAARHFAPGLGASFPPKAVPQVVKTIILSIVILLVIWLVVRIIGAIVRKIIRHGPVKSMDRLGGFLVGLFKGTVLVLAIAILIVITPFGNSLGAAGENSPVLNVTIKIARSMANRYRKALGLEIQKQTKKALASIKKQIEDSDLQIGGDVTEVLSKMRDTGDSKGNFEMTSLKISLDTLSPNADRIIKEILRDKNYMGLSAGMLYDKLKSSGTTIDIDLSELSPEARRAAMVVMQNPTLEGIDIDKATEESGVNLKKLLQQINRSSNNQP